MIEVIRGCYKRKPVLQRIFSNRYNRAKAKIAIRLALEFHVREN